MHLLCLWLVLEMISTALRSLLTSPMFTWSHFFNGIAVDQLRNSNNGEKI